MEKKGEEKEEEKTNPMKVAAHFFLTRLRGSILDEEAKELAMMDCTRTEKGVV